MPSKSEDNRPRLCLLEKGDNGYGFHLHGEKGKTGQFIRLVEPGSPSETSGIRAGDRLVFVNGENVESESHQQVVSRIKATVGQLELIVVDQDTEQLLKKHKMKCLKEYVTEPIPLPSDDESESEDVKENGTPCGTRRESTPIPGNNGDHHGHVELHSHVEKKLSINSEKDVQSELRPRLCVIKKGPHGYGFNLHSEKARPGQYIRAVDEDSPAQRSGLLAKDMIVQVNGMTVEGKQHSEVVAAIKSGGEETSLLVVDTDTDAFFRRCRVAPTPEHLTVRRDPRTTEVHRGSFNRFQNSPGGRRPEGPKEHRGSLPEPVVNGDMEETVNGNGKLAKEVEQDSKLSISPSPSNTSSNASLTTPPTELSEPVIVGAIPGLNLSLQQVKERAHQKRSNKRAPPMDWSKKNELFSNL